MHFNITLHQTEFRVNTQIATLTARCVCWCTFHDGPLYREIFILSPQIPNVLRQFGFILQFGVIEGLLMIVEPIDLNGFAVIPIYRLVTFPRYLMSPRLHKQRSWISTFGLMGTRRDFCSCICQADKCPWLVTRSSYCGAI